MEQKTNEVFVTRMHTHRSRVCGNSKDILHEKKLSE